MKAGARLGLYGVALVVLFAGSAVAANAVVPEDAVTDWTEDTAGEAMDHGDDGAATAAESVRGLSLEQDGYLLSEIAAPDETGTPGELSFRITGADGEPLTKYAVEHEKELHLIVVRSDGTLFRHVHPTMDTDGVWSLPWTWDAAGTYRVFADFVPADSAEEPNVTLTRTIEVAGDYAPRPGTETSLTSSVDGFDVTLTGELPVGAESALTVEVTRGGEPVTTLQPYLGAFGHLVALREGDLAYLHVHPEGAEPAAGELSGPTVTFMTEAPTPGRYLLYLDFQVDGTVHTAAFIVDTSGSAPDEDGEGSDDDHG